MKRLTKKEQLAGHTVNYVGVDDCFDVWSVPKKFMGNAIDRLAAIEDILGDEYELDRLRELVEADREGKIPKYTIGDTVYDRFGDGWEVDDAELHLLNEKPEWIYRCGHAGTYDYCALWEFEAFPTKEAALRREQDG